MSQTTIERERVSPATPAVPDDPTIPPRPRWVAALGAVVLALAGVLLVLYAWRLAPFDRDAVETENAVVSGEVTVISTQLSGYVDAVLVEDFDSVHEGQALVRLDVRSLTQRIAQAEAQLAAHRAALANWPQQSRSAHSVVRQAEASLSAATAQAERAAADLARADLLAGDGSLSLRERDALRAGGAQAAAARRQALAALEIARQQWRSVQVNRDALHAAVAGAQAALGAALVDLDNATIRAPRAGRLGQVSVRRGAYVHAGGQLMGLVPSAVWVIANFKETQMHGVREGQRANVEVDALDGVRLEGHVERISPATGAQFSPLPPDNATGNFVKIAQRIPVRIALAHGQAAIVGLRPGMSVIVRIDTGVAP